MTEEIKGVSGRQLADLLGVSEGAVRKAFDKGRIKKLPNGRFDPVACAAAWKSNTDPSQQRKPGPATPKPVKRPEPEPPSTPEPDKVVQFPGGKGDAAARLARHQADNIAKAAGAKKPTHDDDDDEGGGEEIPALVADLYREKIRKLRGENDLSERKQLDGPLTLLCVETWAREVRDAQRQFADKFCPEIAAALGIQDRQVELYAALSRALDKHAEKTLDRIDPMKTLAKVLECL